MRQSVNIIVKLVESEKAQVVVIARDVDPLEPALCREMGIPYCGIKSESRLGSFACLKTCTFLALTRVDNADRVNLAKLVETIKTNFNDRYDEFRRHWCGSLLGP